MAQPDRYPYFPTGLQIVHGHFPRGQLPLEAALAREFGASRSTVREALGLLREEGLVDRCPGVGTTVAREKYPHGLHRLLGLAETLHEHGEVTNQVRTMTLIEPRKAVSHRLDLPAGEQVVYLERLRRLNGLPLSLDLTYLVRDVGEPLFDADLEHNDIFVRRERAAVGRSPRILELHRLAEELPATPSLGAALAGCLTGADAVVRAAALDVLRALRLGGREAFAAGIGDPDRLGLIGGAMGPHAVLAVLADDADPLVRAAALEASGAAGAPLESRAVKGLEEPDWEVRVGAARCLAAADPETAIGPLVTALSDANQDVRKAAVLALTPWATAPEVSEALGAVLDDPDADVRAYARRAVHDLTRS
ncbi:HEAT repeat domain-containing protein [Nonomuraea sp. NPDC005650]|uniref:HEAT repeat domain-containing protein n=1 Tax=Nonomuraea sp. NPDC005650 TaxID=3157045 RepID=UPI00339F75FB